jgi:class 3 adenylate cyclase
MANLMRVTPQEAVGAVEGEAASASLIAASAAPPTARAAPADGKSWGIVRSNAATGQSTKPRPHTQVRAKPKARNQMHPCQRLGLSFLDSWPVNILLLGATFWVLIADDIRVTAYVGMEHDANFVVVTSLCFFVFVIEILLLLAVRPAYRRSAYLVFDLIATVTLIAELPWMVLGLSRTSSGSDLSRSNTATTVQAAQVARLLRLFRVVRLVRLSRFVKFYRYLSRRMFRSEGDDKEGASADVTWQDNPSAVGRALQESITLQVVGGVLLMMIVFPLITMSEVRTDADYDREFVHQVHQLWRLHAVGGSASAAAAARQLVASGVAFQELVFFRAFDGTLLFEDLARMPPDVRDEEYALATAGACAGAAFRGCSVGGFYKQRELVLRSTYSLSMLAFVIVLLVSGIIVFNRIATRYCIAPIEKLFALVNSFAKDPMAKLDSFGDGSLEELNELEQSIRKIASLLQVGIGLAGRETIARCLRTTGDINPIAVGVKVNCLFGFCDIRQFTDATECLQEQVMLFTNSVGHIVHHSVHDCGGFANKNIGDAFLVAWTGDKLERRIAQVRHTDRNKQIGAVFAENELELASREKWTPTVGDMAIASFIRLTICVRGATHITELVQNPVLQKRLPGYTVRLGCGLHVGWAIEGALGTQKKIDATYLSPATNIAMGLEGATKQYGNLLLISQETFKLFSPFVQKLVRRIDRVFPTAGAEPFDLYTYDLPTSLSVHPDEAREKAMVQHVFDYALAISPEFRALFDEGLDLYVQVRARSRRARDRRHRAPRRLPGVRR